MYMYLMRYYKCSCTSLDDGTSTNPCSNLYGGDNAASEPETKAVQNKMAELANNLRLVISFHTYARMWLMSYGHTDADGCVRAPDHDDLVSKSQQLKIL